MWLNKFIPAVIGIMGFFLAVLPSNPKCYQVPVSITGNFYANSMPNQQLGDTWDKPAQEATHIGPS